MKVQKLRHSANAMALKQAAALAAVVATWGSFAPAATSLWSAGVVSGNTTSSGNWSSNSAPGWNGTGVPNAIGATASFGTASVATSGNTTTQDIAGGITLGTLDFGNSSNLGSGARTLTMTNAITLNQDGAGSGYATISNTDTSTNAANRISIGAGTFTLADDLLISNTGKSTNTSGAITASTSFGGSGNLTIYNVSNDLNSGGIALTGSSTFTGNVLIQKGAVSASSLGNSANAVTLGSSGNLSATLMTTGSSTNIGNNITIASGSGGTLLLGSNSTASSNSIFSGTLTLNDNVTLTSAKAAGSDTRYTAAISGISKSVTIAGTGTTRFGNTTNTVNETYTGNTILTDTASFALSKLASLKFVIGANGINNEITSNNTGNQAVSLDGIFNIDLTGAATIGSWTLVDAAKLAESYGANFTITGFAHPDSDTFTTTANGATYTFKESTGVLTVPEPAGLAMLAIGGGWALRRRRR